MMLEKHFNDPNCILFKIKKRFIEFITRNYGESVDISKIDELIDSINQFMIIMKEVLIDEPHPRTDAFRVTQRFAAYCKELTELLAEASAGGGPAPGKSPGASR